MKNAIIAAIVSAIVAASSGFAADRVYTRAQLSRIVSIQSTLIGQLRSDMRETQRCAALPEGQEAECLAKLDRTLIPGID